MNQIFKTYLKGDKVIWAVVLILSIISLVAVYTSTSTLAYKFKDGNILYYILKHAIILVAGLGIMYLIHNVKYTYFSRIAQIGLFVAIPLLLLTFVAGTNINSAGRWVTIPGINLSFQPSDFAKLALIMFLARQLTKLDKFKDFKDNFANLMLPVFIICGLILPSNFSTAAMLFATSMVVMFLGGVHIKNLGAMIGISVVGFGLFIGTVYMLPKEVQEKTRVSTWIARVERFVGAEEEVDNYQADHSKIAIATGGLLGKGPGKSVERNFLPHPYSDYIYAIIVEEYGLIGGAFVLFLYLILLFRGIKIATKTDKPFAALLAIGCCFSLIFQGMINMAVAVGVFPVTGQPLPLLSMGGTSLWFTSIAIGIILSVSRTVEENEEAPANVKTTKVKDSKEYAIA